MAQIIRTQKEIDDVLNQVSENKDTIGTAYSGMSYEDGLETMYMWLTGESDDEPFE